MPGKTVFDGTETTRQFFSKNDLQGCVARQDAVCADGNKDVRIEATFLSHIKRLNPIGQSSPVAKQL